MSAFSSRLTLQPTELQPHNAREFSSAAAAAREDITAIGRLDARDPMFGAHLVLALSKITERLDALQDCISKAGL